MNTLHLLFFSLLAFSCPSDVMTSFVFVSTVLSSQRIYCLVISGLSQQLLLVFDWQRPKNLQNGGLILLQGWQLQGLGTLAHCYWRPCIVPFSVNVAPGLGWGWWGGLLVDGLGGMGGGCQVLLLWSLNRCIKEHWYVMCKNPLL